MSFVEVAFQLSSETVQVPVDLAMTGADLKRLVQVRAALRESFFVSVLGIELILALRPPRRPQ